jgi:predicted O-methyltransferase YrrM
MTELIEIMEQYAAMHRVPVIGCEGAALLAKTVADKRSESIMVFIDAAKGQYLDYLLKIMDKLSPGAVIFADNVLFRGWVLGSEAPPRRFRTIVLRLRSYLEFVTTDSRFTTIVHSTGDGVAISCYRGEVCAEKTD